MAKRSLLYANFMATAVIFLVSCENRSAKKFLEIINLQERAATDIVLGDKGTESQKLEHMINNDFDSALLVSEKQQAEFDKIIKQIESLSTKNLKDGKMLQTASIQYYQALKNLYGYAKEEIEQQKIVSIAQGEDHVKAQDSLMSLTRGKQYLFQQVYHRDSIFSVAKEQFIQRYKLQP